MPNEFTKHADSLAENYATNPFSKWQIKLDVIDGSTGKVVQSHTRDVSGTGYAHALFEDIKAVLEGDKDIVDG